MEDYLLDVTHELTRAVTLLHSQDPDIQILSIDRVGAHKVTELIEELLTVDSC